jgi:hypothetical protein
MSSQTPVDSSKTSLIADENISLKLQIADLESQILDERTLKKVTYEAQVDSIKATLH